MPRALPQLGPAVGPGAIAVQHVPAQNLDAVCNLARHAVTSSIFADIISCAFKAPNNLRLVAERPPRAEMARYHDSQRFSAVHRAAAKLWQRGVPMPTAMKIINEAVAETS